MPEHMSLDKRNVQGKSEEDNTVEAKSMLSIEAVRQKYSIIVTFIFLSHPVVRASVFTPVFCVEDDSPGGLSDQAVYRALLSYTCREKKSKKCRNAGNQNKLLCVLCCRQLRSEQVKAYFSHSPICWEYKEKGQDESEVKLEEWLLSLV